MAAFARKQAQTVVDATLCPAGIDSTTCFAPYIPAEVRASIPLFHTLPTAAVQQALENLLSYLLDHNSAAGTYSKLGGTLQNGVTDEQFLAFQADLRASSSSSVATPAAFDADEHAATVLSALYSIALHVVVTRVKLSTLEADLKAMNMPPAAAGLVCKGIKMCRKRLDDRFLSSSAGPTVSTARQLMRTTYPKLERFRWRVDVTISNGSLSKVMRPSVTMQMILGDGRIFRFEVSVEQLNQLRYGVAKLLHDMRVMERHPIMRITDEIRQRENDDKNK